MKLKKPILIILITLLTLSLANCQQVSQSDLSKKKWVKSWEQKNKTWRVMHFETGVYENMKVFKKFINDVLVPMKYNAIILSVDYAYDFKSYPQLSYHKINKTQARELTAFCRQRGLRVIPLFNCVGHQSWLDENAPLLLNFPQFDETPHINHKNKGIYCREWCPLHPKVNEVVFSLMDEIIDAFDADMFHVGMDEIFLCGYPPVGKEPWKLHTDWKPGAKGKDEPYPKGLQCPRCKGKDPADLIAKAINDYHDHLVKDKGIKMMMWGDRLIDAEKVPGFGITETSETGSHKAIDMIPKDIIICDWHYGFKEYYPSVDLFQEKGFKVLPSVWNSPKAACAFKKYSEKNATDKMLGIVTCSWAANPEQLFEAINKPQDPKTKKEAIGVIQSMKAVCGETK